MSKSQGRYICFLDVDDYWKKNKILKQIDFLKKRNASIVFTNFQIENNIDGKKKEFYFSKNSFGFRNKEIEASKIDVIFLGGSTTIQMYIEKKNTIVGILNEKFKEKNIFIANAGMEGKSSYGYLCDFKY